MKPRPAVITVLTILCLTSCNGRDPARADLIDEHPLRTLYWK